LTNEKEADFDVVRPVAAAMIESLRAYGYTLNTAIADLIDNSIAAGAKNIWINLSWDGPGSSISIVDDGAGMTEKVLINAMRPGSKNPLEERDARDLGRFGLGLKTASFSQCRSLTVLSRAKKKSVSVRRWDLDYVAKAEDWNLLKSGSEFSQRFISNLDEMPSGTAVILENLDRVVGKARVSDASARRHFYDRIELLRAHLAMVFHRFLEAPNPLKIYLNGVDSENRVQPWDPFLMDHLATRAVQPESKRTSQGMVSVAGYVLPHKDKLGADAHSGASGPRGWNDQQGFYVYRKKRLLVPGSWLGLGGRGHGWTKEEHYKLARIKVDIPGTLDEVWEIDVKKSSAKPPLDVRLWLEGYASDVRKQARQVFAHRGKYHNAPKRDNVVRLWKPSTRGGNNVYKIDRSHPLIKNLIKECGSLKGDMEAILRALEETVPVEKIWLDMAEKPEKSNEPLGGLSENEILNVVDGLLSVLTGRGKTPDKAAIDIVCSMDGFSLHEDLIRAKYSAGTAE
jgi:hypothetical protein